MLSPNLEWSLANPKWASELNPIIANPMTNMLILKNIVLINGTTVIPHKLSRMQQGFIIVDINGAATIYRNAPLNSTTLSLSSTANVTVSIGVF